VLAKDTFSPSKGGGKRGGTQPIVEKKRGRKKGGGTKLRINKNGSKKT